MGKFELVCCEGGENAGHGRLLNCPNGHKGLLRAEYEKKKLDLAPYGGVFKFFDWLPVQTVFKTESSPRAFRSDGIAKELGLGNLWVGFTGYYPERDCKSVSCTFKEMEAYPTYAGLKDSGGGTILLASAGNTARAFAQTAAETGSRCLIVVPKTSAERIQVTEDIGNAKLITVDGDYTDAIGIADRIAAMGGFVSEGGARNVARRDGMGTVMLEAAITIGSIPRHYFQGVGSGTGGISAYEASARLIGDGRFGNRLPELHLSQNSPFAPMAKAWAAGRREIILEDLGNPGDVSSVYADVLTNRHPPYSVAGGVFDAMTACGGEFIEVSNGEAKEAEKLWMEYESARPDPAASVALASLIKAVEDGSVPKNDCILLNMTGGGRDRVAEDYDMCTLKPVADVGTDISDEELEEIAHA